MRGEVVEPHLDPDRAPAPALTFEAVAQLRRSENRRRLAKATSDYFDSLSSEELVEEKSLAASMHKAAQGVDFDREL